MSIASRLQVRVIPNASRDEIVGMVDGVLKVKLQAVAEGGRANKSLCALLARHCDCRAREIRILSGEKSRLKVLEIPPGANPL